jgi:hypothetical protein
MVRVTLVVWLEKDATDVIVLLATVAESVGKRSIVMLGNSIAYGIATLMPATRATERHCILDVSIITRVTIVLSKPTRLRMFICAQI